jgi:phage host-nuclease inhibitor protein Gam
VVVDGRITSLEDKVGELQRCNRRLEEEMRDLKGKVKKE